MEPWEYSWDLILDWRNIPWIDALCPERPYMLSGLSKGITFWYNCRKAICNGTAPRGQRIQRIERVKLQPLTELVPIHRVASSPLIRPQQRRIPGIIGGGAYNEYWVLPLFSLAGRIQDIHWDEDSDDRDGPQYSQHRPPTMFIRHSSVSGAYILDYHSLYGEIYCVGRFKRFDNAMNRAQQVFAQHLLAPEELPEDIVSGYRRDIYGLRYGEALPQELQASIADFCLARDVLGFCEHPLHAQFRPSVWENPSLLAEGVEWIRRYLIKAFYGNGPKTVSETKSMRVFCARPAHMLDGKYSQYLRAAFDADAIAKE